MTTSPSTASNAMNENTSRPPGRYRRGQSGNPAGKKRGTKSFGALVRDAAAQTIPVKRPDGSVTYKNLAEAVIETALLKAAENPVVLRQVVRHAEQYLEDPPVEEVRGSYRRYYLNQSYVDDLLERGFLPADGPRLLKDISEDALNRADQAWERSEGGRRSELRE
jgi:hypothetical protein